MMNNLVLGILITIAFVSALVLFCALLIKLYINKIKNYTRLIYEKDLQFQKTLTETILETQEQVFNNISQELHDDAGQQITYINFLVENLKLDSPQLSETMEPVSTAVSALSHSIRRASHSLSGQLLVQQNVVKAISAEVSRLQQLGRIKILFKFEGDEPKGIDSGSQIVIYRIFQELINNILKHAQATEISIHLIANPFELTVADNGKGFDVKSVNKEAGLGLHNLQNRADIVGLDFTLKSAPGKGTEVILSQK